MTIDQRECSETSPGCIDDDSRGVVFVVVEGAAPGDGRCGRLASAGASATPMAETSFGESLIGSSNSPIDATEECSRSTSNDLLRGCWIV